MTSKERVLATLEFRNTSDRAPRQLWSLPWAQEHYPGMMRRLEEEFEWDFSGPEAVLKEKPETKGDPYMPGEYVDEWGCVFTNIHRGGDRRGETAHREGRGLGRCGETSIFPKNCSPLRSIR